jgi:hypothetical protein
LIKKCNFKSTKVDLSHGVGGGIVGAWHHPLKKSFFDFLHEVLLAQSYHFDSFWLKG